MPRMTAGLTETEWLQDLMERSVRRAGPAMASNFVAPDWRMSAEEFFEFWSKPRMSTFSSASSGGLVHAAVVKISLRRRAFHVPTFRDAVRLADLRSVARCAISSWDDAYTAAIIYGTSKIQDSPGSMVDVLVVPTSIFAIRAPAGHHSRSK